MHLRRALLLFAVVLAVAAIVSLVAPRRRESAIEPTVPSLPRPAAAAAAKSVRLEYPLRASAPTLRLATGRHLQLQVATTVPGEASAFGMVQSAEAVTPAQFDVLVPAPGRYPVTFQPTAGTPVTLATFAVAR